MLDPRRAHDGIGFAPTLTAFHQETDSLIGMVDSPLAKTRTMPKEFRFLVLRSRSCFS